MKRSPSEILKSSVKISRRSLVLGAAQFGLVGVLGARMRFLQVNEAEKYRLLAEENRINVRLLPPSRGLIFDRDGRPIALNVPNYKVVLVREDAGDYEAVLAQLQNLIHIDDADLEKAHKELKRRSAFVPVTVVENLKWEDFSRVAANAPALPGIMTEVGLSRVYPQRANMAHVVGYVGAVSDYYLEQTQDTDPLLQIPRFQVGKTGVEEKLEKGLRGQAGTQRIEVNALGRVMRELDRAEGAAGANLQLSIDSKLQNYALARMAGEHSASAVVIDCKSGDLLAIGSTPTFDPNLFVGGISNANYNGLRDNEFGPLRAKAIQGIYAPASTFKMIVAMAALEAGVIGPEETVYCPGHLEVSGNKFHCWKRAGHGKMNLMQSIMQSCDVYYYTVAQEVGIERISDMARRFGLGIKPDVPLSAVQRGVAPTHEWKKKTNGQDWVIGDTVNASIGQGFVLSSPLQLAVMSARLATGRQITPRLIQRVNGVDEPTGLGPALDVNPDHLRLVQEAMYGVTNKVKGTAFKRRIAAKELRMAGKTGTSQVRRITAAERAAGVTRNQDLPWKRRDHALFVNYAPYDDPKVAVAVVVEHGGGGSTVAAPIARDITLFALTGGLPPIDAYPTKIHSQIRREQKEVQQRMIDLDTSSSTGIDTDQA